MLLLLFDCSLRRAEVRAEVKLEEEGSGELVLEELETTFPRGELGPLEAIVRGDIDLGDDNAFISPELLPPCSCFAFPSLKKFEEEIEESEEEGEGEGVEDWVMGE